MTFKDFTATARPSAGPPLGLYGDTAKRLARAARRSAQFTGELGNRRFLDFVLTVQGDKVVWVQLAWISCISLRCRSPDTRSGTTRKEDS